MLRRRRYSESALIEAVQSSRSIRQALAKLGLSPTGANYVGIHQEIRHLQLDTSHFRGQGWLKGQTHSWTPKRPLSEILVANSSVSCTSTLKRRLIREGILDNRCYECDSLPVWRGKLLVLVLDHINGDNADYRIENLRLLCPNCSSQQPTFAGKNKGRYRLTNGDSQPSLFATIVDPEPKLL